MRRALYGAFHVFGRAGRSALGRLHGALLGWPGAHVPFGSRLYGMENIEVGEDFDSRGPVWIEAVSSYAGQRFSPKITIGARFRSSGGTHIGAVGSIRIGADCLFGRGVTLIDHGHGSYDDPTGAEFATPPILRELSGRGPIVVGANVWIGENAVILGGVEIGDGAVIGANSVVTHDIPARSIAAGAPARVLRSLA